MKKILLILAIIFFTGKLTNAQVTRLTIGVDGFTCSLCAKGVEEQFKSLDFVKSVRTDLKSTTFTLSLRPSPAINVSKIKDAVVDGGFSVRDIMIEAKGTLKGSDENGFLLVTANAPDLKLKNINPEFSDGDKVQIKGKINTGNNTLSITSIKKI